MQRLVPSHWAEQINPAALSVAIALIIHALYARLAVAPFWGDAYHHWLISQLTIENGWVYSDYKGLEQIWLPVYHYAVAIIMAVTGQTDLRPATWLNATLSLISCGIAAALVWHTSRDRLAALVAGGTLALAPWALAYSHLNMPETLAGLLLLLMVAAIYQKRLRWLLPLALLGALTRHELTLLFGVIGLWLVWHRRWRETMRIGSGAIIGLAIWSWWSWDQTGDLLAWWTRYRAATEWDALFTARAGFRPNLTFSAFHTMLQQAFPPLPITLFTIALGITYRQWRTQIKSFGTLLLLLVGAHWLMVGLILLQNLPSINPRYVLISLPIVATASGVIIAAVPRRETRWLLLVLQLVWVIVAASTQLPKFADMGYGLAPERAAGAALAELTSENGLLWVDSPTAIYTSGLPLARFVSSDRLIPDVVAGGSVGEFSAELITTHNIDLILSQTVSYNYTPILWPQMRDGVPFEQDGIRFTPLFLYKGWELDYGAQQTIVWRVDSD